MEITGRYAPNENSLRNQSIFYLNNGVKATVEETAVLGRIIVQLEDGLGYWTNLNGLKNLPLRFQFARAWEDKDKNVLRPLFSRIYPNPGCEGLMLAGEVRDLYRGREWIE